MIEFKLVDDLEPSTRILTLFIVRESSIVAAYGDQQALDIVNDIHGENFTLDDVELVSESILDKYLFDEDTGETAVKTLREELSTMTEPQYLFEVE